MIKTMLLVLLLAGSAFAFSMTATPAPGTPALIDAVPKGDKTMSTPESTQETVLVGSWMTLFLMHNKWNPETKKWEKRVYPKSELRGTYNFATKTWTKK